MITFENLDIYGFQHAFRGMRNPMNSWKKSDSYIKNGIGGSHEFIAGDNDFKLAGNLAIAGTDHSKYRRMIVVWVDITAPLYWWKEFDTYKVGTVSDSCSTMHKIHEREFKIDDFSHEHLSEDGMKVLENTIKSLNEYRALYLDSNKTNKDFWWDMIQSLPSSYNQKRTIMMNYEVLANIYESRHAHKLDEWCIFCEYMSDECPYSSLFTC